MPFGVCLCLDEIEECQRAGQSGQLCRFGLQIAGLTRHNPQKKMLEARAAAWWAACSAAATRRSARHHFYMWFCPGFRALAPN